jgi:hypothetical protein
MQFEPLKNVQVWRFSLYYFFVFGAFVALALWLPRYLIGVYGLDIKTAGMLAAAYSIPGRCSASMAATCPTRVGARGSCTGPSRLRRRHLPAVLSADDYVVDGIERADLVPLGWAVRVHRRSSSCSASS